MPRERGRHVSFERSNTCTVKRVERSMINSKRFYNLLEIKEQPESERLTKDEFAVLGQLQPVLKVIVHIQSFIWSSQV